MEYSKETKTVSYAREIIKCHLSKEQLPEIDGFDNYAGVFVTIHSYPNNILRGCIGIPEAFYPLKKALIEAATSACHDPRFPDLNIDELEHVTIEVTVLTPPKRLNIKREEYTRYIVIGRDGLIVEKGIYRGLLLPQVAVEYKWDCQEFLAQTCLKAGLSPHAWMKKDVNIYTFQGNIFKEIKPQGTIIQVELGNRKR
jgi:uncharacterized protein (TIGR00296 family)